MTTNLGYLFGCCAACRAPLEPSRAKNMSYPENQSVFYMMSRFQEISGAGHTKSDFTGSREMSHIITRARYGVGLDFAKKIAPDKITEGLPGYDAVDPKKSNFRAEPARVFITSSNRGRNNRSSLRAADNELDPDLLEAVDEVADPGLIDRNRVVREVVENITARIDNEYQALWGEPVPLVAHAALNQWILDTDFESVIVDLDYTTACCSLCNDIWDCFARMRAMFQSLTLIPENSICTKKKKNNAHLLPTRDNDGVMLSNLGCMVAYYLHACLKDLHDEGAGANKFDPDRRTVTLLLYWLPMHINAMYKEMIGLKAGQRSSSAVPTKAYHNYVGCLDLLISYYLYNCGCADPDVQLSGFPFERFHVFYVKELSECPPPVWPDPATHERLHDYVFEQHAARGNTPAAEVGYVSDRLQSLYHDVLKPLLGMIKSGAPVADPVSAAVAEAFFLTHAEADELVHNKLLVAGSDLDNLKIHLENAGITAIMWQLRRALREEPEYYGAELDRWIYARMQVEWGNIAGNSAPRISVGRAEGIYLTKHAIPRAIAAPAPPAAPAAGAVVPAAPRFFRCSPWKAALKLRALSFTKPARLRSNGEDDDDSGDDDDDDGGYSLRSLGCAMQSLCITPLRISAGSGASTAQRLNARAAASTARAATSGAAQSRSAASAPAAPASGTAAGAAARLRADPPATPGHAWPPYADWRAPPRTPRRSRRGPLIS